MATPTTLPATFVAGNVLTAAQMNDLRGAFRILQVVRATDTTNRSTTSTSYVDASLSVTITPTQSDSAIIVIASVNQGTSSSDKTVYLQITDSSDNAISGAEDSQQGNSAILYTLQRHLIAYATPATTSATTYKLRFKAGGGGSTTTIYNGATTGQMYAIEVSA